MKASKISYQETNKFSKLVVDYVNANPKIEPFINHFPTLDNFEKQIIEDLEPLSYDLTRTRGRIEFVAQMKMDERLTIMSESPKEQLTFADLQALPSGDNSGKIPKNPLK